MITTALIRQRGSTLVQWPFYLLALLATGGIAVDLSNLMVSHAELRNAADAGALEGARVLYCDDGAINHSGCDVGGVTVSAAQTEATAAAQANNSQNSAVEVVSVERGHWEFRSSLQDGNGIERGGVFTANPATLPADLYDINGNFRTFQDLNGDLAEINAVRVTTARQTTPVQTFFARVLGIDSFQNQVSSVAYVGFAGKINPLEVDVPIALCYEAVVSGCSVGRLVPETQQTGGWTNLQAFPPDGSCGGAANASELSTLVGQACSALGGGGDFGINPVEINLGDEIMVNNGQVNSAFTDFYDCWKNDPSLDTDGDGWPDKSLKMTMPVVSGCRFGGDCATIIGAVEVELLWMFLNNPDGGGKNSIDNTAPTRMQSSDGTWSCDPSDCADGIARWDDFVDDSDGDGFGLQMWDGATSSEITATYDDGGARQKTMYLAPMCDLTTALGGTGGTNFGIRSRVPVLVF